MTTFIDGLDWGVRTGLWMAALGQFLLSGVNMRLERLLKWQDTLQRMDPLMRQVFVVHKWFISIVLLIFAAITWGFPEDLIQTNLGRALSAGIAIFWGIRTVIQWGFYDWKHWQGDKARTRVHWLLTFIYGAWAAIYGCVAAGIIKI